MCYVGGSKCSENLHLGILETCEMSISGNCAIDSYHLHLYASDLRTGVRYPKFFIFKVEKH